MQNVSVIQLVVCKKTLSALGKRQDQGARRPKKRSPERFRDEHFWGERNEDIGVFLEALIKFSLPFLQSHPQSHKIPALCHAASLLRGEHRRQNHLWIAPCVKFRHHRILK